MYRRLFFAICFGLAGILLLVTSCKNTGTTNTAFYYWKTGLTLHGQQANLLQQAAANQVYVRFFDVNWDDARQQAYPNAVVQFNQPINHLHITPVIYITNKTFEHLADTAIYTFAAHCQQLVNNITAEKSIAYTRLQIDCDWTLTTRNKYFSFLTAFKKLNKHPLQATIRLHQVKYRQRTGVPPVDGGVLMFYNMGKFNADLRQPNSIYNEADAAKYIVFLKTYPLKLDIALPLFAWAIHIRGGRVIQVYGQLGRAQLGNTNQFENIVNKNNYRAKQSFFLDGIYIKQNDIFKLEEINAGSLTTAARQLSKNLPYQPQRIIIYYELANINPQEFTAKTIGQVSDHF